jgi:hypothetical protein
MDDYVHQLAIVGKGHKLEGLLAPSNPFRFLDGDPAHIRRLMDLGVVPWWGHPGLKAVLWRPLTVLCLRLDYTLWPKSAWLMHVHSLLWFGAAVALVALLYRRIGGVCWGSGLAALLFAIDDAHAIPAAWIANRNVLIALVFGVLAILLHHKWRESQARWAAPAAVLMLTLSLLAKEEGLSTTAYLFAYAMFLDKGSRVERLLSLMPYLIAVVAWRMAWSAAGGGGANIGIYADPLAATPIYLGNLAAWAPPLLLGQWALPPSEFALLVGAEPPHPAYWSAAVAFIVVVTLVMLPHVWRDRLSRFYGLGMVLSLLPICAAGPADRLLGFVGLGAMGLLARFIECFFTAMRNERHAFIRRAPALGLVGLFVLVHLVLAPVMLLVRSTWPLGPPSLHRQLELDMPCGVEDTDRDFVLLTAPSVLHMAEFTVRRALEGQPLPRSVRLISPSLAGVLVERRSARVLAIQPTPAYLALIGDQLFRPPSSHFQLGDEVRLEGMRAVITELDANQRPSEVEFHFAADLHDSSLKFFRWDAGNFVQCAPPPTGSSLEITAPIPSLW